jgi:uncharacterized OB-fold protein
MLSINQVSRAGAVLAIHKAQRAAGQEATPVSVTLAMVRSLEAQGIILVRVTDRDKDTLGD